MTSPTPREVKAALECPCNCCDASCDCKKVLVAALRQAEAENAALREALDTQRVFLTRLDSLGGLGQMVHEAIRAEIDTIDAALPPAGEEKKG